MDSLEDTSIRSIAKSLKRDHGNISKICTVLEEKGFVYRKRSDGDSRIVNIRLTKQGEDYVDEFRTIVAPFMNKLSDYLTDGDMRFFLRSMENINKLLDESEDVKAIRRKEVPPRRR